MSVAGQFSLAQISGLMRGKPQWKGSSMSGSMVMPTEVLVGDTIVSGDYTQVGGYPSPTVTFTAKVAGVAQAAGPYVVQPSDLGKLVMVEKSAVNFTNNTVIVDSNAVAVAAAQSFADLNYIGGNVGGLADYGTSPLFRNAMFDGRGWSWSQLYSSAAGLTGDSTKAAWGGVLGLTQVSGLSYTLAFVGGNTNPLLNNANDVGRIITITLSGVTYTATITAFGTNSGGTSSCTATLSATPTQLTNITTYSVPLYLDANGWPLGKAEFVVTSSPGQLPGGQTYQMTVKSLNPALTISSLSGTFWNASHPTPTSLMNFAGTFDSVSGLTTYSFFVTFAVGASLILELSDGCTYIDLPRDGSATTQDGGSVFNPVAIAFYSKVSSLRMMDLLKTNGNTQVNWADRPQPGSFLKVSWEVIVDFCNTLYEYPGSKVKQVWLNIAGLTTMAAGNVRTGTTYGENLVPIMSSANTGRGYTGLNPNLNVIWEYGNEPWNTSFNLWGQYLIYACNELQMLYTPNYGSGPNSIVTSVTVNAGVATVLCSGVLPSYIVNGAHMLCSSDGSAYQGLDGSSNQAALSNPSTISNVSTGTDGGGNPTFSFTYPTSQANGTLTGASQRWGIAFNLTSTLATDQAAQPASSQAFGVTSFYNTTIKWMVRQAWRFRQILNSGGNGGSPRLNDRVILNMQQYGSAGPGGSSVWPFHYTYGAWLDSTGNQENLSPNGSGAIKNWLYGMAVAPYVAANGTVTATGNSPVLSGVSTFPAWVVGDQLAIPSGNTNNVTGVGVTYLSAYLQATVTAINGNKVTLSDHAALSTAMTPGSNVMVLATHTGSGTTVGTIGTGVMYQGDNVVTFTTPITGLVVGDTLGVDKAGGYPLSSTVTAINLVNTTSITAAGTGYTNGTYQNVPLTGGSGTGAQATIVIAGGVVTTVTMSARGTGYIVNDSLGFANTSVGGTGSGCAVKVLTTVPFSLHHFAYNSFGGGAIVANGLNNITNAGTGYTNGSYTGVTLTGGTGTGAKATVVVAGGVVTSVTMTTGGSGYAIGDSLSAAASSIGGTGSGFTVAVTAANITYAYPTTGSAAGVRSACTSTQYNTFINAVNLPGLAVGDKVTVIGAGNPSLYGTISSIDSVNQLITLDKSVASQQTLSSGVLTQTVTTGPNSHYYVLGANPTSIIKAFLMNLKMTDDIVRTHKTLTTLVGIHALAYECGPDCQTAPCYQIEVHTCADATYGIGVFVKALLDIWFQNGGEHIHFYTLGPSAFIDSSNTPNANGLCSPGSIGSIFPGGFLGQTWGIAQSFADTTNPKYVALSTYNTGKWYQNAMTYGSTGDPIKPVPNISQTRSWLDTLAANTYQRIDNNGSSYVLTTLSGAPYAGQTIINWTSATVARTVTLTIPVPRSGKFMPYIVGTSSGAGVQCQLAIDGVTQGATQTLVANGAGNVATAQPVRATGAAAVNLVSGVHVFQVTLPANQGDTTTGILPVIQLVLTP